MKKNEILKLLYVSKDYGKLKEICRKEHTPWLMGILAKVLFNEKKYTEAAEIYFKQGKMYESGYCLLLSGDLKNAKKIWYSLPNTTPVIEWGKALLGFLEKRPTEPPTYFQIRNFLEQDLDELLSANLITYAENLINSIDKLAEINAESYKYMARVLTNHKYYNVAKTFLEHSKSIFYQDPETHFLLGKIYLQKGNKTAAKESLSKAIELNNGYFPARRLLETIK